MPNEMIQSIAECNRRIKTRVGSTTATYSVMLALAGCASPTWNGTVQQWGTVQSVLGMGETTARVRLSDVTNTPHAFGLGAIEGLAGEIVIADGVACVSRPTSASELGTACSSNSQVQATLLAVAYVPQWVEHALEHVITLAELDDLVVQLAHEEGVNFHGVIPFVVEGRFESLSMHVINGGCPRSSANHDSKRQAPFHLSKEETSGLLVGFWTDDRHGKLTHHGERTHVHALVGGAQPVGGHVDSVSIVAGATIRVPKK